MTQLQPTLKMAGRLLWASFWRIFLLGFAFGFVYALVAMFIPQLNIVQLPFNIVLGVVLGIPVFSIIFAKRYPHYTVALVDNVSGEPLPRHWKHGLRPWWSYAWRGWLMNILFGSLIFAVSMPFMGDTLKRLQEQRPCLELLQAYKQVQSHDPVHAQQIGQAFGQLDCKTRLGPRTPEEQTVHAKNATILKIIFGISLLIGLLVHLKILQIVLGKRYERFHVRVTPNYEMAD